MNGITRSIDALNEIFGKLVAPLIAVMTVVVFYDVVTRFFTGRPSDWAFPVTTMLYGSHFMLMAAYGLKHRAHVEVDILKNALSNKKRAVVEILGYLIFFVPFISMLLFYGWEFFFRAWERSETTYGMISIPVYPIKSVIVIASVTILLQAISIVLNSINKLREE